MAASSVDVCLVRAALAAVLRLSRIHGTAALVLEPHGNSYIARISNPSIIYCKFFYIALNFVKIVGFVTEVLFSKKGASINQANSYVILLWLLVKGLTISVDGLGAYRVKTRMTQIMQCLREIEKVHKGIDFELPRVRNPFSPVIVGFSLFSFVLSCLELIKNIWFDYTVSSLLQYIVHFVEYNMMILVQLQLCYVMLEIESAFEAINNGFRELLQFNELKRNSFKSLADAYTVQSNVVKTFNEDNGLMFVMIITIMASYSLLASQFLIGAFYAAESDGSRATFYKIIMDANWLLCFLMTIYILIECSHRVHERMDETQILAIKLMYRVTAAGDAIPTELDTLQKQLSLYRPTISPLNIFTLSRSHCTGIMLGVTTYLIIILQHHIVGARN